MEHVFPCHDCGFNVRCDDDDDVPNCALGVCNSCVAHQLRNDSGQSQWVDEYPQPWRIVVERLG